MLNQAYDRALRAFVLSETRKRLANQNHIVGLEAEDALAAYASGELDDTPAVLCELVMIHNELSELELCTYLAELPKHESRGTAVETLRTNLPTPLGAGGMS